MKEENEISYSRRVVAFVDFLGFKRRIAESQSDGTILRQIWSTLSFIREVDRYAKLDIQDFRVTGFSDCVVLSAQADDASQDFLVYALCDVALMGLYHAMPIRGAVTVGNLFHKDNVVFGPGLIRAYELERKIAAYPRIILDPECASLNKGLVALVTVQDHDGMRFADFSAEERIVATSMAMAISPRELLARLFRRIEEIPVLEKRDWLKRLFEKWSSALEPSTNSHT